MAYLGKLKNNLKWTRNTASRRCSETLDLSYRLIDDFRDVELQFSNRFASQPLTKRGLQALHCATDRPSGYIRSAETKGLNSRENALRLVATLGQMLLALLGNQVCTPLVVMGSRSQQVLFHQ